MIIPWEVDVPQDRYPVVNWLIIVGIIVAFVFQFIAMMEYDNDIARPQRLSQQGPQEQARPQVPQPFPDSVMRYMLNGWRLEGLLGHMWLHGGLMHIIGNLLFLWIFGNAVCAKIGNFLYLPLYIAFGVIAAAAHLMFVGGPMIGASGAIYGVVGMYLVFFPENDITCYWVWWFYLYPKVVEFTLSSYWMVLFWVGFDALGAMFCSSSVGGTAYFAHLGGFLAGFATGIVLLKTRMVVMEPRYEKSLLQLLAERFGPVPEQPTSSIYGFPAEMEFMESQQPAAPATDAKEQTEERKIAIEDAVPSQTSEKQAIGRRILIDAVPPPEFIRFVCACGKKVKIPAKHAGKVGKCPQCGKRLKIPDRPPT